MGYLRLWRRKQIIPGVTLNFGKRGISTSIGVRGAHVTLGRRGVRTTVGLPGTGLYYTSLNSAKRATSLAAAKHGRTAAKRRGTPPGWYADPWKIARLRYWDGGKWTGYNSG